VPPKPTLHPITAGELGVQPYDAGSQRGGEPMIRRWWMWFLLPLGIIALLVWGYDRCEMILWVGATDLEVGFVVTEAGSDRPIPGAVVEVVQSAGGFYDERDTNEFTLRADAGGVARKVCRHSMCHGAQSRLGFTDTFVVYLPWWRFRVCADGYSPSEWVNLDVPEYKRLARRTGPGKAEVVLRVSLQKSPIEAPEGQPGAVVPGRARTRRRCFGLPMCNVLPKAVLRIKPRSNMGLRSKSAFISSIEHS
jgi:hypothetical protein